MKFMLTFAWKPEIKARGSVAARGKVGGFVCRERLIPDALKSLTMRWPPSSGQNRRPSGLQSPTECRDLPAE